MPSARLWTCVLDRDETGACFALGLSASLNAPSRRTHFGCSGCRGWNMSTTCPETMDNAAVARSSLE